MPEFSSLQADLICRALHFCTVDINPYVADLFDEAEAEEVAKIVESLADLANEGAHHSWDDHDIEIMRLAIKARAAAYAARKEAQNDNN